MKKILITGSNGMLGRDLIKEFTREGFELYGLGSSEQKNKGVIYFRGDIADKDFVRDTLARVSPDILIHGAAYTNVDGSEAEPDKAFRVNRDGTANLADACREKECLFFLISTDYVFSGKKTAPYVESDPTGPLSVYGRSKLAAEEYLLKEFDKNSSRVRFVIVRTSWLFGVGGKNFVESILKFSETQNPLRVVSDQKGRPTHTVDLARALRLLAEKNESSVTAGIFHVANTGETTWFDFAREIIRNAGKEVEIKPISSKELNRPAERPQYSVFNTERFEAFTGWKLPFWKDTLKDYFNLRGNQ